MRPKGTKVNNSDLIRIINSFPVKGAKSWLANEIGITKERLYRYEKGYNQAPGWITEKAKLAAIKLKDAISA